MVMAGSTSAFAPTGAYPTVYTSWDCTPPLLPSRIVVLDTTVGGVGTHADPLRANRLRQALRPHVALAGVYLRLLQQCAIVEDICWRRPHDTSPGATWWLDLWLGGRPHTAVEANACALSDHLLQTLLRTRQVAPARLDPICVSASLLGVATN